MRGDLNLLPSSAGCQFSLDGPKYPNSTEERVNHPAVKEFTFFSFMRNSFEAG